MSDYLRSWELHYNNTVRINYRAVGDAEGEAL
jgi:hypothetical protein